MHKVRDKNIWGKQQTHTRETMHKKGTKDKRDKQKRHGKNYHKNSRNKRLQHILSSEPKRTKTQNHN